MLYPSEMVDPEDMRYPLIASYKLDGIRCVIKGGLLLSRSGKHIPNRNLWVKFAYLLEASAKNGFIFDGEIYSHEVPFNVLSGIVRSNDAEVPESVEFWCFDMPSVEDEFMVRLNTVRLLRLPTPPWIVAHKPKDVVRFMDDALGEGYEGLILNSPTAKYKNGRITLKSGDGYKLKPYRTFDARIVGVVQATEVDPSAEKKVNELGYSETSKKKGDRIPIEKAAAFEVLWDRRGEEGDGGVVLGHGFGQKLKVTLAMTDPEKEEVWANRDQYIGRWIEYKGLTVGMKDLPRHPVFLRFRDDKE